MIKLKDLLKKEECHCGGGCCSTKKSISEDIAKDIAKEIHSMNEAKAGYDRAMKKMLDFMKKSAYQQYKKSFDNQIKNDTWEYPTLLKKGKTYDKIVTVRNNDPKTAQSAEFFVNRETGDIYKPAGFNAPAKGIRGNIFEPKTYARYDIHGGWLYKVQKIYK